MTEMKRKVREWWITSSEKWGQELFPTKVDAQRDMDIFAEYKPELIHVREIMPPAARAKSVQSPLRKRRANGGSMPRKSRGPALRKVHHKATGSGSKRGGGKGKKYG